MKKILLSRSCWAASLVTIFILGAIILSQNYDETEESLMPPNISRSKAEKLGLGRSTHPRGMTQKIRGSLSAKIQSKNEFEANQPLVYVVEISTDSELDSADYKWIIPPGMELLQGQLEGHLANISPEEPQRLEITLSSIADANLQIHFHVAGEASGMRFTASDQYNTKDQALINEKIKELHEKTKRAFKKRAFQ